MVSKDEHDSKEKMVAGSPEHQARIAELERGIRDDSKSVMESKRPFTDAELRNLDSLEGIRALLGDSIAQATDMGNGFTILDSDSKGRLVGVPLIFIYWQFNKGNMGDFVSALAVQTDASGNVVGKYVINDGSAGIYRQLREFTDEKGVTTGLFAPRGLRRSDYTVELPDKNGELRQTPATTFYVDTSPAA